MASFDTEILNSISIYSMLPKYPSIKFLWLLQDKNLLSMIQ